jgi:hypothetical protein
LIRVLRALWFVSAITISLFNPDNFNRFYGNVTQHCMTNGSYYDDILCGPRGSENLPFRVWKARYPLGYAKFDIDITQSYAEQMITTGTLMGLSAGGEEAEEAMEAGNAWFYRDQTLPPDEQAAQFTYHMCRMWRKSDAGAELNDAPQRYADFPPGSIAYITSSFALETCKRFKFEVFGDVSRSLHNFGLEVAMCLEVRCDVAASPHLSSHPTQHQLRNPRGVHAHTNAVLICEPCAAMSRAAMLR